ncbi:hypothetical protein MMC13_004928 [Lambiella insularis]|nr:hypothetical protein [Lambiella insularis]
MESSARSPTGSKEYGRDVQEANNGRLAHTLDSTGDNKTIQASDESVVAIRLKEEKRPFATKDLPVEVIEQILYLVDPETFASLILVNWAWRSASQTPHLYAHHLSRCPSFSASNNVIAGPFTEESLEKLQRQFVQEVKRNLFEVYLHPRQTTINLISTTTSSSAAFPGGEAFDFTFSPKGRWCLALSSSRIFVIDVASPNVSVQRELKVVRRPLSAAILDNGKRLAVLSTDHKVNIYDISKKPPKFLRSLALDNPPHAISLSPRGEVLAAAYDGGMEVHSLAENALATDQRAVKCDRIDSLAFSSDGTMLLGTTLTSKSPNTVIISAPYFTDADQDMPHTDLISHMWTSQILFPNSSRDCSHATLLPHQPDGDASWTLTYDRVFESFRAVRTEDLRNGTTYFTGPKADQSQQRRRSKSRLVPCSLPTINEKGKLVAAGFLGSEVWMYAIPESLDIHASSNMEEIVQGPSSAGPSTPITTNFPANALGQSDSSENQEAERLPRWQVLVDKYRNVFAKGRRVAKIPGVAGMCWVGQRYEDKGPRHISERLVVAAPGGVSGSSGLEQEELASVDGGRLVILDFDRNAHDGKSKEVTIEVGDIEPEMLQEENVDMAAEIALVRRRTVAQRQAVMPRASVADALRSLPGGGEVPAVPPLPESSSVGFGLDLTAEDMNTSNDEDVSPGSPTEGVSLEEAADALDGPYSHTHPRSRNTLYRSATAVEANRRRNTARIPESGRVEYRRTDGTELPHESDADNWVPPPPPYTADADSPLPEHLRAALTSGPTISQSSSTPFPRRPYPQRSLTTRDGSFQNMSHSRRSSADIDHMPPLPRRSSWQRPDSSSSATPPVSEPGLISPMSSRSISDDFSFHDLPSPTVISAGSSRRRPVSSYDYRSPNYRGRFDYRAPSSISPIPEPINLHQRSVTQPTPSTIRPTNYPTSTSQLTLSGSNLQQRLDYPLPPPPPTELSAGSPIDRRPSPLEPTQISTPSIPPSPSTPQHPPAPSAPSAYQLNNLQNRYSTAPIPTPRSTVPYTSFTQGFPAPTAPRGALGALGRPSAPSTSRFRSPFRAQAMEPPARSLSRSSNRGSGRTAAASTPNLLRPRAERMDTIYSIPSRGDEHRDVEVETEPERARPGSRLRTRSESRVWERLVERRESRWLGRRGRDRGKETPAPAVEEWDGDWGLRGLEGGRGEKKRKGGGKCVVM